MFNWKFWQKRAEPRQGRVLLIPAEETLSILKLMDAYNMAPNNGDRVAKYMLWKKVCQIFPEVSEGRWRLNGAQAYTRIVVEEIVE